MKLYIDDKNCCHTTNPEGIYTEVDTAFLVSKTGVYYFAGKCDTYIEGYRYYPEDNMVTPWKPYEELDAAQREYERQLLAEYESALAEIEAALGV